jgi:hypothetical protein
MVKNSSPVDQEMIFNGINGETGSYDLEPQTPQIIASVARGVPVDPDHRTDVAIRRDLDAAQEDHYGLRDGLDPKELSQAGWGVIFPKEMPEKELAGVKDALKPLLDHRREQAAREKEHYYKECLGDGAFQPKQTKGEFLAFHGRGPGPADPEKLPYYLLIVGDPQVVPYSFQYQLDVQYAVGRIHFESLEDYHRYAVSVVEAEKRNYALPRQAVFFGAANQDDRATQLSAKELVTPLSNYLSKKHDTWKVQSTLESKAYKADLGKLLSKDQAPALLFTASHGMSFPSGDPRQLPHQGALLCQDWPGPKEHKGRIPEDFYFSADDLTEENNVLGMLAFLFACYGAGTPQMDDFYRKAYMERKDIAPHAFLSRLPQRMLTHPKGGALAVIGHVERAWGYSFFWQGVGQDLVTFESTLDRLMDGHPLGSALEYFNSRYAELASDLTSELDETTEEHQNAVKIAGMWTASNDARNYMVMGDPAVRLMVGDEANDQREKTAIIEILSQNGHQVLPQKPEEPKAALPADEPSPVETASGADQPTGEEDYGLLDIGANIGGGVKRFVDKLGDFLSNALENAASLEVKTYVSDNMADVKFESGQFTGANLRALTRIKIDGDTDICVPEVDGEIDTDLWQVHIDMVKQAQESRTELLKTVVSAASGLAGLLKGG